jgi:hypothetical protein
MCDEEWTDADDAIEEVREVRRRLWERFDNDPGKYVAHLQEFHDQLVRDGFKHFANPSKARHVARINTMLGLSVPVVTTPLGLLRRNA